MPRKNKPNPGSRLGIYLPAADLIEAVKLAKEQGISVTSWLRNAALEAIRTRHQPQSLGDLRRI